MKEKAEEVEQAESGADKQEVDDTVSFNRQQEVRFYLLRRCFLKRNTHQEVECQDEYQNDSVHYMIWFPVGNHI